MGYGIDTNAITATEDQRDLGDAAPERRPSWLTSVSCHEQQELEIDKLFRALVKLEGSDLHLKVGRPPIVRVHGELRPLNRGADRTGGDGAADLPDDERPQPAGFSTRRRGGLRPHARCGRHHVGGSASTCLQQMGHIGLVARRVNNWIPDFEGLHLPPIAGAACASSARA